MTQAKANTTQATTQATQQPKKDKSFLAMALSKHIRFIKKSNSFATTKNPFVSLCDKNGNVIYKLYGLDYVVYCIVKKYITRCDYLPYYLQDNSRYLLYDCVNHTYGQTGTEVDEYRDEVKVAILSSLANGNSHEVAISDGYEALKSYLGRDNFDARTNKKLDREEINDIDFIPVVQDICSLNSKRVATTDTKYQGYFEQYFIKEIYDIFDEVKKEHPFVKESKWHMFEKHMLNMSDSDIASEHKVSPQVVNKAWHQIQGWLLEKVANLTQVEREYLNLDTVLV